MDEYTQSYVII